MNQLVRDICTLIRLDGCPSDRPAIVAAERIDNARQLLKMVAPNLRGLRAIYLNTKTGRRRYWVQKEEVKKKKVKRRQSDEKTFPGVTIHDIRKATEIFNRTGKPVTIGRSSSFALDGLPLTELEEKRISKWEEVNGFDSEKVDSIKKIEPKISDGEARGLATYLGNGYIKMNSVLRGELKVDGNYLYAESRNITVHGTSISSESDLKNENLDEIDHYSLYCKGVIESLKKLPPLSPESLESNFAKAKQYDAPPVESLQGGEDWNYHRDPQTGTVVGQGRLRRIIAVDDIEGFVKRYKEGEEVRDSGFVSSYVPVEGHKSIMHSIRRDGNVEFFIDWKKDGTSSGKYVDQFKRGSVELEVLYPPNTAFLVEKIEKNENFDEDGKREYSEMRDELVDYRDEIMSLNEMIENEEDVDEYQEEMAELLERSSDLEDRIAEYEHLYEMQLKVYLKEI